MVGLFNGINLLPVVKILKSIIEKKNITVELRHTQLVTLDNIRLIEGIRLRIQLSEIV